MQISFTDRELDVMVLLWDRGPSTVNEVRDRLTEEFAYTTVLTVLRTLEDKGYVGHREEGRAYRYHPLVARKAAGESALEKVLAKLFKGSPEQLLATLLSDEGLTEGELRRMRDQLDERLRSRTVPASSRPMHDAPSTSPAR